jgi:hypothetical protein
MDQIGGRHAQRSFDVSADTIQKGFCVLLAHILRLRCTYGLCLNSREKAGHSPSVHIVEVFLSRIALINSIVRSPTERRTELLVGVRGKRRAKGHRREGDSDGFV